MTVAIHEVDASTSEHGRLLLQANERLVGVETSFQNKEPPLYTLTRSTPTIEYSLNTNRSFRELVKFFGPHYTDMDDLKYVLDQFKMNMKNSTAKNSKRKWNDGLTSDSVSLVINSFSYCMLLVSSALRSTIFSLILSLAGKCNLQLRAFTRRKISINQLTAIGVSEDQINGIQSCQRLRFINQGCYFSIFLFHGSNSVYKIQGLVNRLGTIINTNATGETLNAWTKDKLFHVAQKSHNVKRAPYASCHLQLSDYFIPLQVSGTSLELFDTRESISQTFDIYDAVSRTNLMSWVPSCNFICFVFFGDDLLDKLPDLLKKTNVDNILPSLTSIQKHFPASDPLNYETPLELVGLKFLNKVNFYQLYMLINKDFSTELNLNSLLTKKLVILIYKTIDQKRVNKLKGEVFQYLSTERVNLENFFIHTDDSYISQLLFHFFHPDEIHVDNVTSRIETTPLYLSETHSLFTLFDKVYNLNLKKQFETKTDVSRNENLRLAMKRFSLPVFSTLYKVSISELSYPLQMIVGNEECYTGFSVVYDPEYTGCILKILSRFRRMGFSICGLKFPVVCKVWFCRHLFYGYHILTMWDWNVISSFRLFQVQSKNLWTNIFWEVLKLFKVSVFWIILLNIFFAERLSGNFGNLLLLREGKGLVCLGYIFEVCFWEVDYRKLNSSRIEDSAFKGTLVPISLYKNLQMKWAFCELSFILYKIATYQINAFCIK